jgi:hypothetical protein
VIRKGINIGPQNGPVPEGLRNNLPLTLRNSRPEIRCWRCARNLRIDRPMPRAVSLSFDSTDLVGEAAAQVLDSVLR